MPEERRSRSRSRGRKDEPAPPPRPANSEQEIVSVAIRQLSPDIRDRLQKLFDEGLLKEGDLDLRSITVFASLNEGLQSRVMNHLEGERIYVANARSKSGFLIATCDKAKTGCLDARGLGAIDPWRTALVAMATPKQRQVDLKPECEWLEQHEENAVIKIQVSLGDAVEAELGVPSVTVELPLTETSSAIKAKLVAMGVKAVAQNKMLLNNESVGFLKDRHSFAFYNFAEGVSCALTEQKRAGSRFRADHTVMPKRPKTQNTSAAAANSPQPTPGAGAAVATAPAASLGVAGTMGMNPLDALRSMTAQGAKMPSMPQMPKLPGLPGLPGLPNLPTGAAAPGALPGLPGLPALGKMPSMPGMPGMPSLPMPGMLGATAPGATMPGAAGAVTPPKLGGLPMPGMSMPAPALGGSMLGLDMAKAGGMAKAMPGADSKAPMPGMPGMPGMAKMSMPTLPAGMMAKGGGMPMSGPTMGSTPKGGFAS
jgi:hypothetical protein